MVARIVRPIACPARSPLLLLLALSGLCVLGGERARADEPKPRAVLKSACGEPRRVDGLGVYTKRALMEITRDGRTLITFSYDADRLIRFWDLQTGKLRHTLKARVSHAANRATRLVVVSPDGRTLAVSSGDSRIHLWDVRTGRELGSVEGPYPHYVVFFTGDSRKLAATGYGLRGKRALEVKPKILLWDVATRRPLPSLKCQELEEVTAASPDGRFLASAGTGDRTATGPLTVKLWDLATGKERYAWSPKGFHWVGWAEVSQHDQMLFSPDSKKLIAYRHVTGQERARIWDVTSGEQREIPFEKAGAYNPYTQPITPDGRMLAHVRHTGGQGRNDSKGWLLTFWDLDTMREVCSLRGHPAQIATVACSPDGGTLAAGYRNNIVRLWDVATGKELATLNGRYRSRPTHRSIDGFWYGARDPMVLRVAFTPDGRTLASMHLSGTVQLWNITPASERVVARLEKGGARIERDAKRAGKPVVGLRLEKIPVDEALVAGLRALPELRTLEILGCQITPRAVAALKQLPHLRALNLRSTTVSEGAVRDLQQSLPKLKITR